MLVTQNFPNSSMTSSSESPETPAAAAERSEFQNGARRGEVLEPGHGLGGGRGPQAARLLEGGVDRRRLGWGEQGEERVAEMTDELLGDRPWVASHADRVAHRREHPSRVALDQADHLLSRKEDSVYVAELIAAWATRYLDREPS